LGNEAMIGNDMPSAKAGDIPNYMKNGKLWWGREEESPVEDWERYSILCFAFMY
jgi:hypothetical protein